MDLGEKEHEYRIGLTALEKLEFCLKTLKKGPELDWGMRIGARLTLEEIIGTLLHARDELQALQAEI